MEREILFRGKRVDNGEFPIGLLMASFDGNYCIQVRHDFDGMEYFSTHKVDYKTVGQFTGLCDKNGVKIFERDVINCSDFGLYEYSVIYENGCFNLYHFNGLGDGHGGPLRWGPISRLFELSDKAEVIGNIHDDEELLK